MLWTNCIQKLLHTRPMSLSGMRRLSRSMPWQKCSATGSSVRSPSRSFPSGLARRRRRRSTSCGGTCRVWAWTRCAGRCLTAGTPTRPSSARSPPRSFRGWRATTRRSARTPSCSSAPTRSPCTASTTATPTPRRWGRRWGASWRSCAAAATPTPTPCAGSPRWARCRGWGRAPPTSWSASPSRGTSTCSWCPWPSPQTTSRRSSRSTWSSGRWRTSWGSRCAARPPSTTTPSSPRRWRQSSGTT
mmetsp:Transcript_18760/g.51709  ORF Transcript_18760/g.51709 Transcript_18760/m.51709 type:complete len:245 (+) Transcript_18760:308-1042(+)